MTIQNHFHSNPARRPWQRPITLIIGNAMSKEITQIFGLHHIVVTPADFIKNEQKGYSSNGLHIFVMKNLSSVLRLVYSCPSISTNPLSVMWCPQTDHPSTEDLMECAKHGIAFVPSFNENRALAMSIIEGRLKATSVYNPDLSVSESSLNKLPDVVPYKHERLAKQLRDYLDAHYHNEHLCIDQMGQDLGMSRTNFFNKVKAMTGGSPSRFVMAFRLHKAKEFLQTEELSVSDVAFKVGFSSTSYFAKCFKSFFQTTPTAFIQENTQRSFDEVNQNFDVEFYVNRPISAHRNIRDSIHAKLEHTYKKKEHN